jgi:arginase family enzyme
MQWESDRHRAKSLAIARLSASYFGGPCLPYFPPMFSESDSSSVHVDLDEAWPRDVLAGAGYVDCRNWGPKLRFSATRRGIAEFQSFTQPSQARFTLFGSGDYHHLSALWLRKFDEPFTLISFDNHPDWDVRPPHWCCGTWINRALELPNVRRAVVWGCGNFELNWPTRLFANHRALRSHRLKVWPWKERLNASAQTHWETMTPTDWREKFSAFAEGLDGERVYVTVDLDCLRAEESVTNWENGLFTGEEVAWALKKISEHGKIIGGDVCGAHSPPSYARWKQRIESTLDHPKQPPVDPAEARRRNLQTLGVIWTALRAAGG